MDSKVADITLEILGGHSWSCPPSPNIGGDVPPVGDVSPLSHRDRRPWYCRLFFRTWCTCSNVGII